ncbi:MAG: carbohydrate kinase family protein [Chloroflexi bacterium]|nr:carbohydrate kinase family protein [Chloroflexota bacterium]
MIAGRFEKKFLLIGDLCVDIFMQIPDYPAKGGDGCSTRSVVQSGGSAANTAIALAHLGTTPRLLTHCGDDLWARELLPTLEKEGVWIDRIVKEELSSTGLTFLAVTPDGERTMFTHRGANSHLKQQEITPELFAGVQMLHLSGYALLADPQSTAVLKAIRIAREKGIGVSLDIGVEPAYKKKELLLGILPDLTLLVLGEGEALALTGAPETPGAIGFLLDHGVQVIGLKRGAAGCLLATKTARVHSPGFPVNVVDTTGAGDAFSAGMIFGYSQDWDLEATALLANAMGALASTRWGAGSNLPSKNEIFAFLAQQTAAPRQRVMELLK